MAQDSNIEQALAQLRSISRPSALIQNQVRDLERRREKLQRDLQEAPEDASAEAEAAELKALLRDVFHPNKLALSNLITGRRETIVMRDRRRVLQLLKRDLEAGRAVLRSLIPKVTLRPAGPNGRDVEIEIRGTLKGILTAEGIVPWTDADTEMVICGSRGSGGRI